MINLSSFIGQANIRGRKENNGTVSDGVGRIFAPLKFSGKSKTISPIDKITGEEGKETIVFKNNYKISAAFEKLADLQNHAITYQNGMIVVVKEDSTIANSLKPSKKAKDGGKSMIFSSNVLDFQLHSFGLLPTENLTFEDVLNPPVEGFKNLQYSKNVTAEFDLIKSDEELSQELIEIGIVEVYKIIPFDKEAAVEKAKAELSASTGTSTEEVGTETVAEVAEASTEEWDD